MALPQEQFFSFREKGQRHKTKFEGHRPFSLLFIICFVFSRLLVFSHAQMMEVFMGLCRYSLQDVDASLDETFNMMSVSDSKHRGALTASTNSGESNDVNFVTLSLSSSSMNSRLSQMNLLVDTKDVIFRQVLCTTLKSVVSIASYQGQVVAAKQLKIDPSLDEQGKEAQLHGLIHEVHILSKINHPCIVKLLGGSVDPASPILLTEFLENQDVESLASTSG